MSLLKKVSGVLLFLGTFLFSAEIPPFEDSLAVLNAAKAHDDSVLTVMAESFVTDSVQTNDSSEIRQALPPEIPLRTVLYLGGGEGAAWYHLGVFYALRDYHIPIDSMVVSSWGSLVGSLVSSGWELDEIQRFLLEPEIAPFLTDESLEGKPSALYPLAFAETGNPALEWRFSLKPDSAGWVQMKQRNVFPDTLRLRQLLFKLRIQESLERDLPGTFIPLSVNSCAGNETAAYVTLLQSIPFFDNPRSGELCAPIPYPASKTGNEIAVLSVNAAFRESKPPVYSWKAAIRDSVLRKIDTDSASSIILRPYRVETNAPQAWMQAGYNAVEKKSGEFNVLAGRIQENRNAPKKKPETIYPRFRFYLSADSISSEIQTHVRTFWNPADTGINTPRNFLFGISQNPVYDSLQIQLEPGGDFSVDAFADPLLDIRFGGFGSNLWGANAFGTVSFRYINQFEYLLSASAFYGVTSRGFSPELRLLGLGEGKWDVFFKATWADWVPLKEILHDIPVSERIYSEKKSDYLFGFDHRQNSGAVLAFQVLVGQSNFETESDDRLKVKQMYPHFIYRLQTKHFEPWFGSEGYSFEFEGGLKSVFLSFDLFSDAPLYLSSRFDFQKYFSLNRFMAFGLGATGALNVRRNTEYPEPLYLVKNELEETALTSRYRAHAALSPWSVEELPSELSSHHYVAARASLGAHIQGTGFWLFAAYLRDFENHMKMPDENRISLEGMFRFRWKSVSFFAGLGRITELDEIQDLKDFKNHRYFVQIGTPVF
ncbi:MAG: hypothetical protein LBR60_06450 [Fibrobacter sp.]|jgi:NTE family protein|nr:hypothetical protein [Fibrobacter sp.]